MNRSIEEDRQRLMARRPSTDSDGSIHRRRQRQRHRNRNPSSPNAANTNNTQQCTQKKKRNRHRKVNRRQVEENQSEINQQNEDMDRGVQLPESVQASQSRELPGFHFDPETNRYYAVAPEGAGLSGYTNADAIQERRRREIEQRAARVERTRGENQLGSVKTPICGMLDRMSLGGSSFEPRRRKGISSLQARRNLAESKLMKDVSQPNFIAQNPFSLASSMRGCQFLTVSEDGKSLLGCWTTLGSIPKDEAFIISIDAVIDDEQRARVLREQDICPSEEPVNAMGLDLRPSRQWLQIGGTDLVDMCVAKVDTDVTCCLYVAASNKFSRKSQRIEPTIEISLEPVAEWSTPECVDMLQSPIYNLQWTTNKGIWSCAWSSSKMLVALGFDDSARITDVLAEQHFTISSRKKQVLSQQFSQDGNLIYMGLRADNVIRSDLRMPSNHVTGSFGARNVSNVHVLTKTHPNCLITENLAGDLVMWDARNPSHALLEFKGHSNHHSRLSLVVDHDENFLFAVGDDGITRGWSLMSGGLLCCVPSPLHNSKDYPRIAYSDRWGGRAGNTALVVAVNDQLRVHQFDW